MQLSPAEQYLLVRADCRHTIPLADESVHCVVTSPPYWQLRDYKVPGQIGLEPTIQEYVATIVEVFREVRRVLRKDGVAWLNLGDSFNDYNGGAGPGSNFDRVNCYRSDNRPKRDGGSGLTCKSLKPKDLVGMPWHVALALQEDGWWLRRDVIWGKKAPMRESIRDRPITAHEYLFLLSRSRRYFYDHIAVRQPDKGGDHRRKKRKRTERSNGLFRPQSQLNAHESRNGHGANLGSVWMLGTEGYRGQHYATFPTHSLSHASRPVPARRVAAPSAANRGSGSSSGCRSAALPRSLPTGRRPGRREPGGDITRRSVAIRCRSPIGIRAAS